MSARSLLGALVLLSAAAATPAFADGPPRMLHRPHAHPRRIEHAAASYPPNARPGDCFARVKVAALYQDFSQPVLLTPARRQVQYVPASYAWQDRQVLVTPAHANRRVIPATYRQITEEVVVTPATSRIQHTDAVYETVAEQVVIRPAHTEWRRTLVGPDGVIPADAQVEPTGEVVCLVKVPAQYGAVERRVLREPARDVQIPVPAVTRVVTHTVVDQPERVVEETVPAVYRTEHYRHEITPAHHEVTEIAAVYGSRTVRRLVSPAHFDWRKIDCPTPRSGADAPPRMHPDGAPPPPPGAPA